MNESTYQSEWYPGAAFDVLFFPGSPNSLGAGSCNRWTRDGHRLSWTALFNPIPAQINMAMSGVKASHITSARPKTHLYSLSHPKNVGPNMRNILTLSCGKPVPVSSQASCRTALTSAANNAVCPCYCSPYVMLSIFTPLWK